MVDYAEAIERLIINGMVTRKIKGGRQRFIFDVEASVDYKITAYNNAQDVRFQVYGDCRGSESFVE